MEAELFGEVAMLEGCLRVASFSGAKTDYFLVCPPDFRLNPESDGTQVPCGDGQVVARVGENVFMGGGEVRYVQRQLAPSCTGPYGIISDLISSAKPLEVLDTGVHLILQPPTVGDRVNMLETINNELVLDEGCLRMGSANRHLIVWPPRFSLTTEDDEVQILNESGPIVARVGEKVRKSGGK